jgi:hypothetical protein
MVERRIKEAKFPAVKSLDSGRGGAGVRRFDRTPVMGARRPSSSA